MCSFCGSGLGEGGSGLPGSVALGPYDESAVGECPGCGDF